MNRAASYEESRSCTIAKDLGVPRNSMAASCSSSGIRLSKFQCESATRTSVAPAFRQPSTAALASWVIRCRLRWYASPPLIGSVSISLTTPQIPSMSIEMKTFIDSALRPHGPNRLNVSEARRFVTRRGIPGACLSVEMCTSIYQRGLPPGGVRPHHGIEEEQDHEESQERQALNDSHSLISLSSIHLFPFLSLFFISRRRSASRSWRTSLTSFPSALPRTRSMTRPMR